MSREMKDIGTDWIGTIPSSWNVSHFKFVVEKNESGVWGDDPQGIDDKIVLRSTEQSIDGHWRIDNPAVRSMGTVPNYQDLYCKENDLLITKSSGSMLHIGKTTLVTKDIADRNVLFSNFLQRVRLKPDENAKFYWYILNSDLARKQFSFMQNSTSGIGNLNATYINNLLVPRLPIGEQLIITKYLDAQCASIDSVLTRTRASVEEYKKLKQAVITQAVTKGIRGKRPMKDSGVEWIGTLPMDWSITVLKYCASLQAGITLGKKYPKGTELIEVPYLRVANVQGDHVDVSDVATIQVTAEEIEKYALHDGELLMTEGGDRDKLGRGTIWHGEIDPCIHQNHVFAVETDESKLLVRYFDYVTSAAPARTYFDLTAKKTTNLACTNSTTILRYRFALPPITEQYEIVDYLDIKCAEIDKLIAKKEQYLVELENYKKSLIYEYVTGKKEV